MIHIVHLFVQKMDKIMFKALTQISTFCKFACLCVYFDLSRPRNSCKYVLVEKKAVNYFAIASFSVYFLIILRCGKATRTYE